MNDFALDPRLANDTIRLGTLDGQILLLMNNALVPWFILVPVTDQHELHLLDPAEQQTVLRNINLLSCHLTRHFTIDKINIGAIGNIVEQLHIHIVGRTKSDHAWPAVVWGNPQRRAYTQDEITAIRAALGEDAEMAGYEPYRTA